MAQVNREQWLMKAVEHIVPIFERAGYAVPVVKVSVGFPSTGGKGRHLGQCWSSKKDELWNEKYGQVVKRERGESESNKSLNNCKLG